jgi:predicted phage-related endonuclease
MAPKTTVTADVALDRGAQTALTNLKRLKAERADIDARIKAFETRLKTALGDSETGTIKGKVVVTWKRAIRTSLSATMVAKKYPEVAAECRDMQEIRTFKLIED